MVDSSPHRPRVVAWAAHIGSQNGKNGRRKRPPHTSRAGRRSGRSLYPATTYRGGNLPATVMTSMTLDHARTTALGTTAPGVSAPEVSAPGISPVAQLTSEHRTAPARRKGRAARPALALLGQAARKQPRHHAPPRWRVRPVDLRQVSAAHRGPVTKGGKAEALVRADVTRQDRKPDFGTTSIPLMNIDVAERAELGSAQARQDERDAPPSPGWPNPGGTVTSFRRLPLPAPALGEITAALPTLRLVRPAGRLRRSSEGRGP